MSEIDNTRVTVTLGFTKNLGNFESLRVDIGIQDHLRSGENINDATDRVYKFVEKKLEEKATEIAEYDRAKELLDYYFKTNKPGHPVNWFFMNFDSMDKMLYQKAEDEINRKKLKQLTKQMVEEMESNEHRSSSN